MWRTAAVLLAALVAGAAAQSTKFPFDGCRSGKAKSFYTLNPTYTNTTSGT